jgi:hypothetical protein
MNIISSPTIWSCKTPNSGWLNLAQVRQLHLGFTKQSAILSVWITWSNGSQQFFEGDDAKAIINSWQEASQKYQQCVDNTHHTLEQGE